MEKEQISFFDFQGRYGREEYRSLRENGMYYPERLEQGCMGFRKSLLEKNISPYGLHFFDCASMHFLTKFFLERLREDFILLLFDHQADLKRREARALCHNSWLRQVMVRLPHCRGILLLGATEEEKGIINDALMTLGDEFVPMQGGGDSLESRRELAAKHPGVRDPLMHTSLYCFTDRDFQSGRAKTHIPSLLRLVQLPLYCSMDKDIFGKGFTEQEYRIAMDCVLASGQRILGMNIFEGEGEAAPGEEFNLSLIREYKENACGLFQKTEL